MGNRSGLEHHRHDTLISIAQAWFPRPEFTVAAHNSMETWAVTLRVEHRGSGVAMHQLFDDVALDSYDLRTDRLAGLSRHVHYELCRRGWSDPLLEYPNPELEEIRAVCYLAGWELRYRQAQGHSPHDGLLIYMVSSHLRPPQAYLKVELVSQSQMERSFAWWQQHVASLITGA